MYWFCAGYVLVITYTLLHITHYALHIMEIFLSKQCLALVGMLERGLGYYIRSTKTGRFFGQRSKHSVPPDGHWRFIVLCAEMARNGLYITDVRVRGGEIYQALKEAGYNPDDFDIRVSNLYNATDIINFRREYLLNQA